MQKYLEVTAKTEDEAIVKGLAQLGLDRDDVSVEILERGKTGFLGIGSIPAKVRLTYEREEQASDVTRQAEPPAVESPAVPVQAGKAEGPAADEDSITEKIIQFQTGLFSQMKVKAVPEVTRDGDVYLVVIKGENLGALIGYRGETLNAIQQITGCAVNRNLGRRVRIYVDAEGYRARREEALEKLARKTADKVVSCRRNITLDTMNAYERHVIHSTLQNYPGVSTYSTGAEPNRRTVVAYNPSQI